MRLSRETLEWIVRRAREIDAEDVELPAEEEAREADEAPDAPALELASWIADLTESEQAELVALYWIGRGDGEAEDFEALVEQARASQSAPTERYLLDAPLLADHLEAGLDALDALAAID
jgi:hypothetical protein